MRSLFSAFSIRIGIRTNDWTDPVIGTDLLEQIDEQIEQVSADGAYDTDNCFSKHDAKPAIPPRKNAVIWQHGNCKAPPHPRNENLRSIRKHGRKKWKQQANYHRLSLPENAMFRHKTASGGKGSSRKFDNRMIQLGKPLSVPVAA